MITDNIRTAFWDDLAKNGVTEIALGDNGDDFFVYCSKEELVKKVPSSFDGCNVHAIFTGPFLPATT